MKTKLIFAILVTAAIVSFGASRINRTTAPANNETANISTSAVGGLGSEDR